jgi:phosphoglycerate dehydrogenase-like enzyme
MQLLIINEDADYIKKTLAPKFPELSIQAATTENEVGDLIQEANILLAIKISDELLKKASNLYWIQSMITGVDYILNLPSLRKEVLLTSSRGIHGPQMSELAILFMLALNRNFPQIVRNQEQKVWDSRPVPLLYKKKAGILGLGVIGQEIARKCKAFGMTVFGIDLIHSEIESVDHFYGPEGLDEVLQQVDYFVNVVPSTPDTRNMIGAKELSTMKPTAFLINIGRGETVDEEALVHALKTKKIAGAALDVFCEEPLPKDHPLWEVKNVIITPHVGGKSDIYADQVLPIFEENLRRFLGGERRDLINFIEH